jgi:hypothetical protein
MKKSLRFLTTMLLLAVFGTVSAQNIVFKETFDQVDGEGGNDGTWAGVNTGSTITTDNVGWTFEKQKKGDKCVILGSTNAGGKAITPEINVTGNGTLTFRAGAWDSQKEKKYFESIHH